MRNHAHCSLCCSLSCRPASRKGSGGTVRSALCPGRRQRWLGSSRSGCAGTVQVHANDSPPWPLAELPSAHRQPSVPLFLAPVSPILHGPHRITRPQLARNLARPRPASSVLRSPRLASSETPEPYPDGSWLMADA